MMFEVTARPTGTDARLSSLDFSGDTRAYLLLTKNHDFRILLALEDAFLYLRDEDFLAITPPPESEARRFAACVLHVLDAAQSAVIMDDATARIMDEVGNLICDVWSIVAVNDQPKMG